jgi:hypothetical protein
MPVAKITFVDWDAAVEEAIWLNAERQRTYAIVEEDNGTYWVVDRMRLRGRKSLWDSTLRNECTELPTAA